MFHKIVFFYILSLVISACSSSKTRSPSSDQRLNFNVAIADTYEALKLDNKQALKCREKFNFLYKELFEIVGTIKLNDTSDIELIDKEIDSSFKLRLMLLDSIKNRSDQAECGKSKQDVFRLLRILEDFLIAERMEKSVNPALDYNNFNVLFPYLKINPTYVGKFNSMKDLKVDDIILYDQSDFSSSSLERIKEGDHYYSHTGVVVIDSQSHELAVKLSFFEIGEITIPILDFFEHLNSRLAVYRPIKGMVGQNVKENVRVQNLSPFFLNFKSLDTQLNQKMASEFQFDSAYEEVLEWVNPRKIEESRHKEMILSKLFNEIEKNHYVLDPSQVSNVSNKNLWILKRPPFVRQALEDKRSLKISQKELELFLTLDKLGEEVFKILEKKSLEFDRPMTPLEVIVALDNIFQEDILVFKSYIQGQDVVKPAFHLMFHP